MQISFVIPTRNNLKYVQQAYRSIKDSTGNKHEIVLLDDASTDDTWNWMQNIQAVDSKVIIYRNPGPERVGHTILYDKGIELSTSKVFSILHADMIITPNYVDNLVKHLKKGTVVCATRVEPPLHPPGPEKHVKLFGTEPEDFKKEEFAAFVAEEEAKSKDQTTNGIFAPWCMFKEDFIGHDPLFAPMELEDSDIFNRMHLAGYNLIQSRDALVYHMTCRGSRFKDGLEIEREIPLPDGTIWYKPKDSEEYKALRNIKFREWWRKWSQDVLHDELMMPIVQPKYDIGYIVKHCNLQLLSLLEPWSDTIYIDNYNELYPAYSAAEQPNTLYDLRDRIFPYENEKQNNILVSFDATQLNTANFKILQQLPLMIKDSGEVGLFQLDIFRVDIIDMTEYQDTLIYNK